MSLPPFLARIRNPIDIGFFAGAVALILVGWISHRSTMRLHEQAALVEHTYEVMRALDHLETALDQPRSDSTVASIAIDTTELRRITADNVAQQDRLDTLRALFDAGDRGRIRGVIARLEREEQHLLAERRVAAEVSAQRATTIILFSTVLAVLLMAIALALLHADLRRRRAAEVALQDSQIRYQQFIEHAADAILVVDSRAVCIQANERAAQIIGRPQEEITGLPLSEFVRSEDGATGAILPMLRYGHVTTGEFSVIRPDASQVAVEVRATMLDDGNIQVIARDVSERKEIERLKDEFLSVVSHELRTPLTSIRGALGLLAGGKFDDAPDKRQRMVELAVSNTDRLIRLINEILDLERMRSGRITFEPVNLPVTEVVDGVVEAMRPIADRTGVSITNDADTELRIFADPDRMAQALTNLIGNAIKFSPAGSAIDVRVRRHGRFARFEVRDHGRGIPREMLELIFDRFRQVDNSDAREKGGTGLGLAISRSIVEQHGGTIWVESEVGVGSTFRFLIPLVPDDRPATANYV